MKTKLMFAVMSCLLFPLLCANLVFAQTDSIPRVPAEQSPRFEEDPSKAGMDYSATGLGLLLLFMKCEDLVYAKAVAVDGVFRDMVKDSAITKGEMKEMENAIAEFDNLRKEAEMSLRVYGVQTTVDVFSPYRKITKVYFEGRETGRKFGDTPDQTIRKTLTGLVGYDVTVHAGLNKSTPVTILIAIIGSSIVALLVGKIIADVTTDTKGYVGYILTFLFLLAGFIFLL